MEMEVPGTKPKGRPKETWMKNIAEDMCEWNPLEEDVYDRDRWRALIKSQTKSPWKKPQNGGSKKYVGSIFQRLEMKIIIKSFTCHY